MADCVDLYATPGIRRSMPTPVFALRLSARAQADLAEMAKLYGSPNPRAFAREVLETMSSGDAGKAREFLRRLFMRAGEQLAMQFTAPLEAIEQPRKPARKGRSGRKRGRRPKAA